MMRTLVLAILLGQNVDPMVQADALYMQERFDEAAGAYEQALRADPSNHRAAYRLGWCYNELKKHDAALAPLKLAVRLNPADAESHAELGFAYRGARLLEESLTAFAAVLELRRDSSEAFFMMGRIHNELGRYERAIEFLGEVVRRQPEAGKAYEEIGFANERLERYGKAAEAYLSAAKFQPDAAGPVKALAEIYARRLDDPERAILHYRRAAILAPDDVAVHYELGSLLAGLERFEEAVKPLEDILFFQPKVADLYDKLGYVYRRLNRTDDAVQAYAKSIDLTPESPFARVGLGDVYFDLKDYPAAMKQYEAGLQRIASGDSVELFRQAVMKKLAEVTGN